MDRVFCSKLSTEGTLGTLACTCNRRDVRDCVCVFVDLFVCSCPKVLVSLFSSVVLVASLNLCLLCLGRVSEMCPCKQESGTFPYALFAVESGIDVNHYRLFSCRFSLPWCVGFRSSVSVTP